MLKFKTLIAFFLISNFLFADSFDRQKKSIFDLVGQNDLPEVVLQTNLSSIIDNKLTSKDYHQGIFSFSDNSGKKSEFPVKVKARGKFRRKKCEFPPLKLKFKKAHLAAGGLDTFNKMKLVTHCLDDLSKNASNIEKEYLAYKIYNELTEQSFRVQLVKIKYVDTAGKRKPMNSYAFLIEEDEQVADRLGGQLCECYNQPSEKFESKEAATLALFNYMIGNPDYNFRSVKNLKMIQMPDGSLKAVPYDFDYSVFVSPPYLNFKNSNGNERVYKAFALTAKEQEELKEFFFSKKENILQLINDFNYSSRHDKALMRRYIKQFYNGLSKLDLTEAGIKSNEVLAAPNAALGK